MDLRYANNSNYKNDTMIRKEAYVPQWVREGPLTRGEEAPHPVHQLVLHR
jgi:hypothetical protein